MLTEKTTWWRDVNATANICHSAAYKLVERTVGHLLLHSVTHNSNPLSQTFSGTNPGDFKTFGHLLCMIMSFRFYFMSVYRRALLSTHAHKVQDISHGIGGPSFPDSFGCKSDDKTVNDVIQSFAKQVPKAVSIRQMFSFGVNPNPAALLAASQYLHREVLVRMSRRVLELQDLPFGLSQAPHVQHIIRHYLMSIREVNNLPIPANQNQELEFTHLIERILNRHRDIVSQLAQGMKNNFMILNRQQKEHFLLQESLDRFNLSRLRLRLMMAHHVQLHKPKPGFVGIIQGQCNPRDVVIQAAADATEVCKDVFGIAPTVNVLGTPDALYFRYIPLFLRYIMYEILKNACRAVIEFNYHPGRETATLPSIDVRIIDGDTDITIKVSDRGGGIRRADMPMIFTYSFTTPVPPHLLPLVKTLSQEHSKSIEPSLHTDHDTPSLNSENQWMKGECSRLLWPGSAMFGDAFGLPLARLYARALGGDLQIYSVRSHGSDAFIYLPKLTTSIDYPLPD